jgi:glycosyltransferase involved in cell wall biosynthesis
MDLSIVITTRNRKEDLLECVNSVRKSNLENLEWELIVVDDNSSDGTREIKLKELGGVENGKIIHNAAQQMMVRSRNTGAKCAQGKYILFIDDDNIIDSQMPKNLIVFLEKNKNYGLAGPSMYYLDTRKKYMDGQEINFFTSRTTFFIDNHVGEFCDTDGIPNVFVVRKEVFVRIGFFDESLIQTMTEPDFAFSAAKNGYKCAIVKKAKTYHKISLAKKLDPESLGGDFSQKAYCLMRNRSLIISRYAKIYHKIFYLLFFSWFWPFIYSVIVMRKKRFDLVRLYWLGWKDGMIYFFTGKLKNSLLET